MSYFLESKKTRSEKVTLATINSVKGLKLFTMDGSNWKRSVDFFVESLRDGDTVLSNGIDWEFLPLSKELVVYGGVNPKQRNIIATFKHFFSNAPYILPNDLLSGEYVEWDSRISSIGSIGQQLDDENTGIVLESQSSIELVNSDAYFDSIFDSHIWENQSIKFYFWFPSTPITEKLLVFDGVIESKSFTESKISFRVKDFVFKLKNVVNLGLFSSLDGNIPNNLIGKAKRRIYGKADNVKCAPVDAVVDGYVGAGVISASQGSTTISGVGSFFLDEVSPEDILIFSVNGEEKKINVQSISSNTSISVDRALEFSILPDTIYKVSPKIPWRKRNRTWMVCGHKLRAPEYTITSAISGNAYTLNSVEDFEEGDLVSIDGQDATIRRISGNDILLNINIVPTPSIGTIVRKEPIREAHIFKSEVIQDRDYTITNSTYCNLVFNNLSEFNIAQQKTSTLTYLFTNGSRSITTSGDIDLKTILKSRDWVRTSNISNTTWYEILEVKEKEILIRTPASLTSGTISSQLIYKNVEYLNDDSVVVASTTGLESESKWMRTASDAVRHMILNDSGFSSVNESSFAKAKSDCMHTLSMVIPDKLGDKAPTIKDVITKINASVFGSLYGNLSSSISFSVLNSDKPESIDPLRDDDILSFSVQTNQKIANKTIVNYSPYFDIYSEQDSSRVVEFESSFVNRNIGIQNTIEKTIYLYEESSANVMAQRTAFFNSLSNSNVTIKGKLNLSSYSVNDKVYIQLDRLFSRYGSVDKKKLCVINGIKRDSYGTEIVMGDLGNILNRVPSIAPNSTSTFSSSSDDDKIKWGYVLDNDTLTPDVASEDGLGNYLIG